jgi:ubiquitin-protein ligase
MKQSATADSTSSQRPQQPQQASDQPAKGAAAAVARSQVKTRPVNVGNGAGKQPPPEEGTAEKSKPHPLAKQRCRAAAALAQDCNDVNQLTGLTVDVFSVYLDDPEGFLSFVVFIKPTESLWRGATFGFRCSLPTDQPRDYPYRPPRAVALPKFKYYHPNIGLESQQVSTKALEAGWTPKLRLRQFLLLLHDLLVAPDAEHAVNVRAGRDMLDSPEKFQKDVQGSLNGSRVMLKLGKATPPEEVRFPSKLAQAKMAAEVPSGWRRLR